MKRFLAFCAIFLLTGLTLLVIFRRDQTQLKSQLNDEIVTTNSAFNTPNTQGANSTKVRTDINQSRPSASPKVSSVNATQLENLEQPPKRQLDSEHLDTSANARDGLKTQVELVDGKIDAAKIARPEDSLNAGEIVGKINLKGTPAPEKELPLDPNCGKLHTEKPKTHIFAVGAAGELADVFVYIKDGLTGKTFEVPSSPVTLDQHGCEYSPYVSGAQVKQTIAVKNSDPLLHNVHPTPTVAGNKESNQAQVAGAKDLSFSFEKPEVFLRFKCDVHPWMFAYVGVVDSPYYSVSGKDGSFKIANVPDGKYTVEAYHRKGGKVTQDVTVAGGAAKADFTIEFKAQ